jgi:hypothetical protein
MGLFPNILDKNIISLKAQRGPLNYQHQMYRDSPGRGKHVYTQIMHSKNVAEAI